MPEIGSYRPASRLREGWHIQKADNTWSPIASLLQVTSPIGIAMVELADGTKVNIPHTDEVLTRNTAEIKAAANAS